jgi:hypothetical protein
VFAAGAVLAAGVILAAVFSVVFGTTLRAIGRGFGRGTLGLAAQASTASAEKPTANVRLVAKAVDRNAAGRRDGVTAFFRGESFNR